MFASAFSAVVVISDVDDPFAPGQKEELEKSGLKVTLSRDIDRELPSLDVVYINAIAWLGEGYEEYGNQFRLNKDSPLKPDAIILHPLARGDELSPDLDDTPHNWYFAQARGAVFIRMALLSSILKTFV